MTAPTYDPVRLALVQNQLDHIARVMGRVMEKTARSTIFSESHDFSCFITNARGELLSVADGLPIHTGGGGFAVRKVLEVMGAEIEPGDVFLSSDPYEGGGNHLPDWTVMRPVFRGPLLIAFTCNRAHQSDIGGGAAGTYNPAATEIFHEGIRLPPLWLVRRGATRRDVWHLLCLNSRTPDLLDGDLRAMLGSTAIGEREMLRLIEETGTQTALATFDAILDHAEAKMREALIEIPDGTYTAEDVSFTDCFEERAVKVAIAIHKQGSSIVCDFSGSSPQIRGFKNSSLPNTTAACAMAILAFLKPQVPRNEGTLRALRIIAPEGTVVNARAPAPMTMNTVYPAFEIINCVWKALAQARADWAISGWGKTVHCISSGFHPERGERFVLYHWHAYSGSGAVAERDGFHTIGGVVTLGGLLIPNVETYEQLYPIQILQQEIRCDSCGAGARRGGAGIHYRAKMLIDADYSLRGEGLNAATGWGVNGGLAGGAGELRVSIADGASDAPRSADLPRYGLRHLPALEIEILSPGGGGWGHPHDRPPEQVLADVRDGLVSLHAARTVYAVAISPDDMTVDEAQTSQLRAR